MVRLLSVEQYGQYRDFLLYGTLLLPWAQLSANSSIAYFVPREPENGRMYLTQASLFVLVTSGILTALVFVFGSYFPSETVREHLFLLCLYVIFVTNLDGWEVYWIAKRQTMNVLYYSVCRLGLRMSVVVAVAYLSRSIEPIIWALVVFEGLRLLALALYGLHNKLFTTKVRLDAMQSQIAFFLPIGIGYVVYNLNTYLGQFFVSMWLGVAMLAIYSVANYLYPIVRVFRNSIADVIMPEIVSQRDAPPNQALRLWQRATVVYCAGMLPLAVLLCYYADVIVELLFTSRYAAATPVFRIFTLILVRECFDFSLPLRAVNRTRVFLVCSLFVLGVNLLLMLVLFDWLGVLAPAIATVAAAVVGSVYLGVFVIRYCGFTLRTMLPWSDIGKIALAALAGTPLLIVGDLLEIPSVPRAFVVGIFYSGVYLVLLLRTFAVSEIVTAAAQIRTRLQRRSARGG